MARRSIVLMPFPVHYEARRGQTVRPHLRATARWVDENHERCDVAPSLSQIAADLVQYVRVARGKPWRFFIKWTVTIATATIAKRVE